jgi:translation initiation factor IF-3
MTKKKSSSKSRRSGNNRRKGNYRSRKKTWKHKYNKNQYIKSDKVRVVMDGKNLGVTDTKKAIRLAKKKDLDLVEVAPNADPPVCKIMSWSKFLYEKKKKAKKARKHKHKEQKEFRFGTYIGKADKDRLIRRSKEYLDKGHNVKITVTRKRRTPYRQSKELLNELLTHFEEYSTIGSRPSSEGYRISQVIKGKTGK